MDNPRAIGFPALVLGIVSTGFSLTVILQASSTWTSPLGVANIAGMIGGAALTVIGVAILQGWGEFAMGQTETQ